VTCPAVEVHNRAAWYVSSYVLSLLPTSPTSPTGCQSNESELPYFVGSRNRMCSSLHKGDWECVLPLSVKYWLRTCCFTPNAILGHPRDVSDQPVRENEDCMFDRAQIDNLLQRLRAGVGLSLSAVKSVTDLQLTLCRY
jgi:hypothetical protein